MLAIKFRRIGRRNQPSFRIVVAEKRSKISGRFVEDIGWRNPKTKDFKVNEERAKYWLEKGAQPTDTVYNLLVKIGLIKGKKRPVHGISKRKPGETSEVLSDKEEEKKETVVPETQAAETQVTEVKNQGMETEAAEAQASAAATEASAGKPAATTEALAGKPAATTEALAGKPAATTEALAGKPVEERAEKKEENES